MALSTFHALELRKSAHLVGTLARADGYSHQYDDELVEISLLSSKMKRLGKFA